MSYKLCTAVPFKPQFLDGKPRFETYLVCRKHQCDTRPVSGKWPINKGCPATATCMDIMSSSGWPSNNTKFLGSIERAPFSSTSGFLRLLPCTRYKQPGFMPATAKVEIPLLEVIVSPSIYFLSPEPDLTMADDSHNARPSPQNNPVSHHR